MIRFLCMFAAVVLLGCPPNPVAPPPDATDAQMPPPPPPVPSPTVDAMSSDCTTACVILRGYGCPEGFSVPGGDSCEVTCSRVQGLFDMKPTCIAHAATLDGIRACGPAVKCKGK